MYMFIIYVRRIIDYNVQNNKIRMLNCQDDWTILTFSIVNNIVILNMHFLFKNLITDLKYIISKTII